MKPSNIDQCKVDRIAQEPGYIKTHLSILPLKFLVTYTFTFNSFNSFHGVIIYMPNFSRRIGLFSRTHLRE